MPHVSQLPVLPSSYTGSVCRPALPSPGTLDIRLYMKPKDNSTQHTVMYETKEYLNVNVSAKVVPADWVICLDQCDDDP